MIKEMSITTILTLEKENETQYRKKDLVRNALSTENLWENKMKAEHTKTQWPKSKKGKQWESTVMN